MFVTGKSQANRAFPTDIDYATVAYNAATGTELWASRYNGPAHGDDEAAQVAVSPDGRTVFVTGASDGGSSGRDYATVAYDAATGAQLWVSRYNGPRKHADRAVSLAVAPSGHTVYVTGTSGVTGSRSFTSQDYATVAYDAATGAQQWVRRYNGPGKGADFAAEVAVSPTGRTVFVTGTSTGAKSSADYATIAYAAATGAQRWIRRYNAPANLWDQASAMSVSPDGRTVFVTGDSTGASSRGDYATIAYHAATGAIRWVRRYNDPKNKDDNPFAIAVGPGGRNVFVTGGSTGAGSGRDYLTIAYNAGTGSQRWVRRYNNGANDDIARSVTVSPGGSTLYITGQGSLHHTGPHCGTCPGFEYATVAYNAATGTQRWVSRYNNGLNLDAAVSVAVSSDGDRVFVTGGSEGGDVTSSDYATIAYQG
jgi:hypothetical protein